MTAAAAPRARGEQQASSIFNSSSEAFNPVLNVIVPGIDITNTSVIDKLYLGTQHIGAGLGAFIPSNSGATGATNLTYTVNNTIQDGLKPDYWEAFYMGGASDSGSAYVVGMDRGPVRSHHHHHHHHQQHMRRRGRGREQRWLSRGRFAYHVDVRSSGNAFHEHRRVTVNALHTYHTSLAPTIRQLSLFNLLLRTT